MIDLAPSRPTRSHDIMRLVLLAASPGLLALTWFFGFGTLVNLFWAVPFALAFEALALRLRGRPVMIRLNDGSATITAMLLAIALPPASPWWLILIATAGAILLAKQLYGGLGHNPFNPAMVGYALVLIAFPQPMTSWLAPRGSGSDLLGPIEALLHSLGAGAGIDGRTMATPLELVRYNQAQLMADLWARNPQFGVIGGRGWEWVNAAFLAGGLFLLQRRIFTWHAPAAMLATLALMSALFYDGGSSASGGSPLLHLFTGGTMIGAFFVVTDPVTSAASTRGRLIHGATIGVLVSLLRLWGNYPDAIAFAVLLLNFAAPFIDHCTRPHPLSQRDRHTRSEEP